MSSARERLQKRTKLQHPPSLLLSCCAARLLPGQAGTGPQPGAGGPLGQETAVKCVLARGSLCWAACLPLGGCWLPAPSGSSVLKATDLLVENVTHTWMSPYSYTNA